MAEPVITDIPKVPLGDPDSGRVSMFPADQVPGLVEQGFRPLTEAQVRDFMLKPSLDLAPRARAFGEGALQTALPFGVGAAIAGALDTPEEVLKREELYPAFSMAGSATAIAGQAVAAPLLRGLGAAEKAAAAAAKFTAPSIFERAGVAAERGLAKLAPEALGVPGGVLAGPLQAGQGTALARLTMAAANQAAQGALYGVNAALNRAVLEGDLVAEELLREGAMGAALGGLLGGAGSAAVSAFKATLAPTVGGLETLAGALARGDKEAAKFWLKNRGAVAELESAFPGSAKLFDSTSPKQLEWLLSNKTAVQDLSAVPHGVESVLQSHPEVADYIVSNVKRIKKLESDRPGVLSILRTVPNKALADDIVSGWETALDSPAARREFGDTLKQVVSHVYEAVSDAHIETNVKWRPQEFADLLDNSVKVPTKGGKFKYVTVAPEDAAKAYNKVLGLLDGAHKEINANPHIYAGSPVKLLEVEFDAMVQTLGKEKVSSSKIFSYLRDLRMRISDPIEWGKEVTKATKRNTQGLLKELRSDISDVLKDKSFWKELAERQTAFDAAESRHIQARKALIKSFVDKTTGEVDATKIDRWVTQISRNSGKARNDVFQEYALSAHDLAKQMTKSGYPEGAALQATIDEAITTAVEARDIGYFQEAVKEMRKTNPRMQGIVVPDSSGRDVALQAAGYLGLGRTLSKVTRAVELLNSPYAAAKAITTLESAHKAFTDTLERNVVKLLTPVTGAGVKLTSRPYDPVTGENFQARLQAINELAADPETAAALVERQHGNTVLAAPNAAILKASKIHKAAKHMQSKMPRPAKVGVLDRPYRPSATELRSINRHGEVVNDPMSVLARVKEGRLTEDHVQALDATYPETAREIRTAVAMKVAEGPEAVRQLPRPVRQGMSHLLGYDLEWGHSALAIAGTQRLYQSMGAPAQAGEATKPTKIRSDVDVSLGDTYATSTEASAKSLNRQA